MGGASGAQRAHHPIRGRHPQFLTPASLASSMLRSNLRVDEPKPRTALVEMDAPRLQAALKTFPCSVIKALADDRAKASCHAVWAQASLALAHGAVFSPEMCRQDAAFAVAVNTHGLNVRRGVWAVLNLVERRECSRPLSSRSPHV